MKYAVFIVSALGVPLLAYALSLRCRWYRYVLWGMCGALAVFSATKLNFFSHEFYRGSSRGMEVSVVYLFAASIILAQTLRHRFAGWFPDACSRIYLVYFLLCLPSMVNAANGLYGWFEIWKMAMLHLVYLAVLSYLRATDDVDSLLLGLAWFAAVNFVFVLREYFIHRYQARGVFPHQNSMAMAMMLLTPLFFAAYLAHGAKGWRGRMFVCAFVLSGAALLRSYSRAAIAIVPIASFIVLVASLGRRTWRRVALRMVPVALAALVGVGAMAAHIIERFERAPESSGNTRIELAKCAWEMIKDKPLAGVGINNWGVKINEPYPYARRAGRAANRSDDYKDGIVETVYLLVGAECGIPALVALLAWFAWNAWRCVALLRRLRGTPYRFIPAGLLGGFCGVFLQSCLEWVLRQQINFMLLMMLFALVGYLDREWKRLREKFS